MKKLSLFLMVVAVVVLSANTSQAILLSLYTFDSNANNSIGGAPNGTLVGNAAIVGGGAVGGAVKMTGHAGNNYVNLTANAYPQADAFTATEGSGGGFWIGTQSFWFNSTDNTPAPPTGPLYNFTINRGAGLNLGTSPYPGAEWYVGFSSPGGNLNITPTPPGFSLLDGQWHLQTVTHQLTTGDSGTGSISYYIDGVLQAITVDTNTITSASNPGTILGAYAGIDANAGGVPKTNTSMDGMLDDIAVWNNRLSDTQVLALYNLGTDALDYNAQNAQSLFDIFATGTSNTVAGTIWEKVASGLAGAAGTIGTSGSLKYLVLDGSGGGVKQMASAGQPGDYNNNGKVDAADYVLWRDNPAGFGGDPAGYNTWRANFGNPPGSGSALSVGVPEPTTLLLVLLSVGASLWIRCRGVEERQV